MRALLAAVCLLSACASPVAPSVTPPAGTPTFAPRPTCSPSAPANPVATTDQLALALQLTPLEPERQPRNLHPILPGATVGIRYIELEWIDPSVHLAVTVRSSGNGVSDQLDTGPVVAMSVRVSATKSVACWDAQLGQTYGFGITRIEGALPVSFIATWTYQRVGPGS